MKFDLVKIIPILVLLGFGMAGMAQNIPKKHRVEIKKMKFLPANINVQKGDTVIWVNKDFYPHDVTDENNNAWTSGPFGQNETRSKVITKPENYFCNLHKTLKGTIKIIK